MSGKTYSLTGLTSKAAAMLILFTLVCGIIPGVIQKGAPAQNLGSLIQQGVRLFQSGNFEEASVKFEEALNEDPSSTAARQNLANTWAALGQAAIVKGGWPEAKEHAEKAVGMFPENPEFRLLLAVILFRQGDYYYSRLEVRKTLDFDPDNSKAHELLGDIHYQEGYLDLAVPEWEEALKQSPNRQLLKNKISKTEKEMDIEQGFKQDFSNHFALQFDGPVPDDISLQVLEDLEELYDGIGNEIGSYPISDIKVILYPRMDFRKVTSSPRWVGGTFDGKIRVPVGGLKTRAEAKMLKPILAHELTHAFLRSIVPQGLPLWFEEGLAEYFEGTSLEMVMTWLDKHSERKYSTLEEINASFRRKGKDIHTAYFSAALAVLTLIEEEGFWTVRTMLEELGKGRPFEIVLQEEARLNIEEFQELWRRSFP